MARTAKTADFSLHNIGVTVGEFVTEFVAIVVESVVESVDNLFSVISDRVSRRREEERIKLEDELKRRRDCLRILEGDNETLSTNHKQCNRSQKLIENHKTLTRFCAES